MEQTGTIGSGPQAVIIKGSKLSALSFYQYSLWGLTRKHQLLPHRVREYETQFHFQPATQQEWFKLFQVPAGATSIPFTYFVLPGVTALFGMLDDLQVNFRNLLQLKSRATFNPHGRTFVSGATYPISYKMPAILPLPKRRVALVLETTVTDTDGSTLVRNEDYFIIKHMSPEAMRIVEEMHAAAGHDVSEFQGLFQRQSTFGATHPGYQTDKLVIGHDMGVQYGHISGDRNVVHTRKLAARMFGFKRPFIQGLCTVNYVLKTLAMTHTRPIRHFNICFARPIYVDQTVDLLHTETEFEVKDRENNVLAFGQWDM